MHPQHGCQRRSNAAPTPPLGQAWTWIGKPLGNHYTFWMRLFALPVLGMLPWIALAQSALPTCPPAGPKHQCTADEALPGGERFSGAYVNNRRNGPGVYTWPDGRRYEGEFRDDKRHGRGKFTAANGEVYTGDFRDDRAEGVGVQVFPDGRRHVGEYRDDRRHGRGIEYRPDQSVARSGTWERATLVFQHSVDPALFPFSATGTQAPRSNAVAAPAMAAPAASSLPMCPPSGARHQCWGERMVGAGRKYVGEFRDDKANGQGTLTFGDGARYVGQFQNDKRHGQGILTSAAGATYVGEFRENEFHGRGTVTLPNQEEYTGEFLNSLYHGEGTYTWPDGRKYAGEFREDKRHGQGTFVEPNGVRYVGEFRNGERNGFGTTVFPGGTRYVGEYRDGKFHGQGVLTVANGDRYEGEFKNGELTKLVSSQASPMAPSQANPGATAQQRPAAAARPERRVALVIGNAAYKSAPLTNPVNDAEDIASALKALSFDVTMVRNASLRQMREATRQFEPKAAGADVALIFFAGHGVESSRGRNFMMPVDAQVAREYELEDQAYDAGQWLSMLEGAKGPNSYRVNIVILDACRDNPMSRQWRSSNKGLGRMDAPSGTLLVYSTAPGRVAADGKPGQRNSPFTKSLLSAIQRPNLPVEQVLKEVRRSVMTETNGDQIPWENSSLIGDFVFKR